MSRQHTTGVTARTAVHALLERGWDAVLVAAFATGRGKVPVNSRPPGPRRWDAPARSIGAPRCCNWDDSLQDRRVELDFGPATAAVRRRRRAGVEHA